MTSLATPLEPAAASPEGRHRWRALAIRIANVVVLLVTIAYLAVSYYVTTQVNPERHLPTGTPADVGLVYQPIAFTSAQDIVPLKGWYLPATGSTRAIILVHGVDGNRWDTNGPWLPKLIPALVHDGFNIVLFDLRMHGESGGSHAGLGVLEERDVQGAVSLVEQRGIRPGHIGLFGQSYGGSIALLSTAEIPDVAGVVSDSAFADVRDKIDIEISRRTGLPPIFTPGVSLFESALYGIDLSQSAEKAMPRIAPRPVLIIHGTGDDRTPVENAYRLKAASSDPDVQLWIVPGAGHTESYVAAPQVYTSRLDTFFDRALGPE